MWEHSRAFMHTGAEGVPPCERAGEGSLRPRKLELDGMDVQDRWRNSPRDDMKEWISRDPTRCASEHLIGSLTIDWLIRGERRGWLQLTGLRPLNEAGGKLFEFFRAYFILYFQGRFTRPS